MDITFGMIVITSALCYSHIFSEAGHIIEWVNSLSRWCNQDVKVNNYQREKNSKTSSKQVQDISVFCIADIYNREL